MVLYRDKTVAAFCSSWRYKMILPEMLLSWGYFPAAVVLGGLHALEPGHAKTLTAAYLIGIKGTKRDALLLGLSVALTHSIVVVGLAVIAIFIGAETFSEAATRWLHLGSAVAVITLGVWMLASRWLHQRKYHGGHGNEHSHSHSDGHSHHHSIPEYAERGERPTFIQIALFGAAGGMLPCPASVTVMLLAVSTGRMVSGVVAVSGFSLGLASTLVGVGMVVVSGVSRFSSSSGRLHWISKNAPTLSAIMVIVSGVAALIFG